jgi:NAD(P)-dependent dehydrogenase (short-subunit alcohol dehydrogenase family)
MKTAVVTGGNSGIGFETARELARRGWRVIITGRDAAKLRAAAEAIGPAAYVQVADFASFADVRGLGAALDNEPRIDVLLNNVGVALSRQQQSRDGNDMMLQVNHLSSFLLTSLLLDKLKANAPARIVNVSSRMHRNARDFGFDDFQFTRSYSVAKAYSRTKLYNVLFTRELARRLAGTGVDAYSVHPGSVATRFGYNTDGILNWGSKLISWTRRTPEKGAETIVYLCTEPRPAGASGDYFFDRRARRTSRSGSDLELARRLWEASERVTGFASAR